VPDVAVVFPWLNFTRTAVVEQYMPGCPGFVAQIRRFIVKKIAIMAAVAPLALLALATPHSAQAAGCIRGAIVGGVVGRFAGHHGLVGAGAGCAIGHHEANKRMRERDYDSDHDRGY
jgi:hypothetical protein